MGSREGPWEWLCGWCSSLCSCCRCHCGLQCSSCSCCACQCTCIPLLCPSEADRLKVEEVSAADYIHEKKKMTRPKIRQDTVLKAALRSFAGFCVGLFITTIYAFVVLFIKNYNLWFCLTTTATLGLFMSLGMAFSLRVRITVLLMLPQIFSGQAKTIFLLLAFTLVVQGPTANIMENLKRSSQSMACGAQLALNQTKEMTSKITKPLMSALSALKDIGKKLRSTTDHGFKFFQKLFAGIKHIGKLLRGAWAFIANIGDICNEELERPYIKCNKLFDEAKNNCFKVMSFMSFLCFILDGFRPLCGLARILIVLCAIPDYVQYYLRKNVKNPLLSAIRNFKEQFDFNMTVIHDFDVKMNSSRSFYNVAAAIVNEMKENVDTFMEMLSMFSYSMVIVCFFTYIQALRYRRKYLIDVNHDNIYITRAFIELDVMRAKQKRNTLLPLSSSEGYGFIRPGSLSLTKKELKGYVFEIINVFRSFLIAALAVVVDYVFFWVLDMVSRLMKGDVITRAPSIISLLINGTGHTEEIFAAIASAFDAIQNSNITIHTTKCQVLPSKPNYHLYLLIGFVHGLAFFIAIFGVYMQRMKRYICAYYYPTREQTRICFLYNKLLTKRMYLEKSLFQSIKMNDADKGHTNILLILAAKCPWLFGWLANHLRASEQYCMACAQVSTGKLSEEYQACSTYGCTAMYCPGCSKILNNTCSICMAPLVCDDFEDEEIDSSDDERVALWIEAAKSIKKDEKEKKKKMKKLIKHRLKETAKYRGKNKILIQKYKESLVSTESEESSALSEEDNDDESEVSDIENENPKVKEAFYNSLWKSPTKTVQKKGSLTPVADAITRNRRKERDEEKGFAY